MTEDPRPVCIDFCCGAGGMSHGFASAGFRIRVGVDSDPRVGETFRRNHLGADFLCASIADIEGTDLPRADVVIGGPPCPDFSYANRNRDPVRGMRLVREFIRLVHEMRPKAWVMENVPPAAEHLPSWIPTVTILNAADYGVPQVRRRVFAGDFPIPRRTHIPHANRTLDGCDLKPWVTVRQALGDLALMYLPGSARREKNGGRVQVPSDEPAPVFGDGKHDILTVRIDGRAGYLKNGLNDRFEGDGVRSVDAPSFTIRGHGTRHAIAIGYPARSLRPLAEWERRERRERMGSEHIDVGEIDEPAQTLNASSPPVLAFADGPATTIQAGPRLNPPGHHSSRNPKDKWDRVKDRPAMRRLTPRECARLQGFPDSFEFVGPKTWQYRMIGNAVPPPVAEAIAKAILQTKLRWEVKT